MEAAATASNRFNGWSRCRGEHAPFRYPRTRPIPSQLLLHLPCTPRTTSLNLCKAERLKDGWLSTEARKRGSKIQCRSTLTDTVSSRSSSSTSTTYINTHAHPLTPPFTRRPDSDEVGMQELTVYEVNEGDRNSPVLLPSSKLAVDGYNRWQNLGGLGDLVPFTNKLFDGSLKKRLGITAGLISVIQYYPKEGGYLFESIYSFYFGDFGHISVQGPYKTHEDTVLMVTGGSGIFNGVYGTVKIQNVEFPRVLFYTFNLHGIRPLPQALRWKTVPPAKGLRPSYNASFRGVALPNFTD